MGHKTTPRRSDAPTAGPGRIRGLTRARYLILSRMVRAGEATWPELEKRGLAFPPKRESEFRREVKRLLKE